MEHAIDALSNLAEQAGPFFFAVLFLLIITKTARGWYRDVCIREPHEPAEERVMRTYFISTFAAGMLLVVAAVGWWMYERVTATHMYRIVFEDLQSNQYIELGSDVYYVKWPPTPSGGGPPDKKDFECVVLRDHKFRKGELYRVHYWVDTTKASGGPVGQLSESQTLYVAVNDPDHSVLRFQLVNKDGHLVATQLPES
jgi:hypothetical protein